MVDNRRSQASEVPNEVLQLVDAAKSTGTLVINFRTVHATEVVDTLASYARDLHNITELRLTNQRLNTIPKWIFELTQLEALDLTDNELADIPESLSELHNLTQLGCSENNISNISDSLFTMSKLEGFSSIRKRTHLRLRSYRRPCQPPFAGPILQRPHRPAAQPPRVSHASLCVGKLPYRDPRSSQVTHKSGSVGPKPFWHLRTRQP